MIELGKPGGVPCPKLRRLESGSGAGCSIHARRPQICRGYSCLWLSGGLKDGDRPDRLGAVIDIVTRDLPMLRIHETRAGAFSGSPRLREIAEHYRASMPVRIGDSEDPFDPDRPYRVLLPGGEEQRVMGESIEFWREGEQRETRRLPWLERVVRRVSLRLQAQRWRWLEARRKDFE